MATRRRTMGAALDESIKLSTEEWFRQHCGMRSREEALANDVQLISGTVERRPGGLLKVHVGIVTRNRNSTMSDFYVFRQSGELGYVSSEDSQSVV